MLQSFGELYVHSSTLIHDQADHIKTTLNYGGSVLRNTHIFSLVHLQQV